MQIGNWEFDIVPYHWALPLSIFWMPGEGHAWNVCLMLRTGKKFSLNVT